jgi:hypothetical protein
MVAVIAAGTRVCNTIQSATPWVGAAEAEHLLRVGVLKTAAKEQESLPPGELHATQSDHTCRRFASLKESTKQTLCNNARN